MLFLQITLKYSNSVVYLFASEPHKHIPHDALPLALEHTFLERVQELKVLLDQKPQSAGKRTEGGEQERERERENASFVNGVIT